MCGVLAGAPLDTVRIRQQQPGMAGQTIATVLRNTFAGEGFKALFRGMSYPLTTAALQNAVVFHTYSWACRQLQPPSGINRIAEPVTLNQVFWAGCFSGAVQTVVVTPVDLLKIRLQLQTKNPGHAGYLGPLAMLRQVLHAESVRGLFRGTSITAIRDVPSHGVYFGVFQAVKNSVAPSEGQKSSALAIWIAGGVAGAASWLSVYPFDVIKSRIQAAAPGEVTGMGWRECARASYQAEGGSVFFRGLVATLSRAFFVNGAIFLAYEAAFDALQS